MLPFLGDSVLKFVQKGGGLLLYNPTECWESLPEAGLPGRIQPWVCNHPSVQVIQPAHPIVSGYRELCAHPISRFQATSAQVLEATHFAPFIKSFVTVSNEWESLTYPSALVEAAWGRGRIVIDLIPENRVILLRSLAYLLQVGL